MIRSLQVSVVVCLMAVAVLLPTGALADIVQPVSIHLKEQEPNAYLVQWQVPQVFPVRAMPEPLLPEDCRPRGERVLQEQPGTWLNQQTFRCEDTVAGRVLAVNYPFLVAGQSTMMRVDFLSGEQLVHALNPGEYEWRVPEIDAGLADNLWFNVRQAVLEGSRHFLADWVHLAFWLAAGLLATMTSSLRVATAFALAQLVAIPLSLTSGLSLPPSLAEGGIAVGAIVLASQILKPTVASTGLVQVGFISGLVHALGLSNLWSIPKSYAGWEWLYQLLAVLGMDATLLVLVFGLTWLRHLGRGRGWISTSTRMLAYTAGSLAVFAALVQVLYPPNVEADSSSASQLPAQIGDGGATGGPGSRRVAAQGTQAPIQSFVSVEAFEVRNEILVRLRDVATDLGVEPGGTLPIEAQPGVKQAVLDLILPLTSAAIDGRPADPVVDRIDFMTVGTQGVLPRPEPVPEYVEEGYVGVTLVYITPRTPQELNLTWDSFPPGIFEIPATVSDPEFSQTQTLTAAAPALVWQNNLSEDPVPTVAAIEVAPGSLPIPVLALPLLAAAAWLVFVALRGRDRARNFALARVLLVAALIVAPIGEVALALPAAIGSVPSSGEARRILSGVLPNVYRAFEFREESDAYDRLAVSVTGETLSEVYLEHRRALEMEERGGARARVEAVEVKEIRSVDSAADGGFTAEGVWTVGGTVTHFGHRHFRQNRYDARVTLIPVEGIWKIQSIELFDEERLR